MNEPNKEYLELVKRKMPKSHHLKTCFRAFWVGGLICCIGQGFHQRGLAASVGSAQHDAVALADIK